MSIAALFGLSVLMSFLAFGLVTPVAVAQPLGLGDRRQQLLVEGDDVAAGFRALARAEDEAVMFGGEPDEVEFLHARYLQPVGRASLCADVNTRLWM